MRAQRTTHGPLTRAIARLLVALMLANYPLAAVDRNDGPFLRIHFGAAAAQAQEVASTTLGAVADTTLSNGKPNVSRGAEPELEIGGSAKNRALVRFDAAALLAAIGGGELRSAKLELFVAFNRGNWSAAGRPVGAYAIGAGWSESGATWECADDTNLANNKPDCDSAWDGGLAAATATDTVMHTNETAGRVAFDVTADVRSLGAGSPLYGWAIVKSDANNGGVLYGAREGDPERQPRLVVAVVPTLPPSPTSTPPAGVPTLTPSPTPSPTSMLLEPTPTPPAATPSAPTTTEAVAATTSPTPAATVPAEPRSFDLTAGHIAWIKDRRGARSDQASFHFLHDPALAEPIPDPRCPAASSVRIFTEHESVEVVLPCANWTRTGTSYQYRDPRGSVHGLTRIKLHPDGRGGTQGELRVQFRGDGYGEVALHGPAATLGLSLSVAEYTYCGIFTEPPGTQLLNQPEKVLIKGPSIGCNPSSASPTSTASDTPTLTATPTPLPPTVRILAPANESIFRSSPIEVSGEASNAESVTINDIAATLGATSFAAPGVPLTHGFNTLTATATGPGGTADDSVLVILNTPPVADAGANQSSAVGRTVTLDASGSSDTDGDGLSYQWILIQKPADSAVALSDSTAVRPSFVVDRSGSFVFQLAVNDGFENGGVDTVTISTENSAPAADAGDDRSYPLAAVAMLDGSRSSDPDGDALVYRWLLVEAPAGSSATLSDPSAVRPTLVVDRQGSYTAQLVVSDGRVDSEADTVRLSTINSRPVADAGAEQSAPVGAVVELDGSASYDPDGDALSYRWSISSRPAGSAAVLDDPSAPRPRLAIDRAGSYVLQLIVNDSRLDSVPDAVVVATLNSRPVADAGEEQEVLAGAVVHLDGSGCFDPDDDPLDYSWSFTSVPFGSKAALDSDTVESPAFVADRAGAYVLQLIVHDGAMQSLADTVVISAGNRAPVAADDAYTGFFTHNLEVPAPGVLGNDFDPDDDPIVATLVSPPSVGTVNFQSDGSFTYSLYPPPPTPPATPGPLPAVPRVTLTNLFSARNDIGIAHHTPSNKIILSVNYSNGRPYNFAMLHPDGTLTQYSTISNLTNEVKIATARDDGGGVSMGGFVPGELFVGTGTGGRIAKVAADGSSIVNPWVALVQPNGERETGLMRGSLHIDRTGVWGGDLIAVTTTGGVWRIKSDLKFSQTGAPRATKLASLGTHLEGVLTIPNDPRYGPWAGKIVIGAEGQQKIYTVSTTEPVASYQLRQSPSSSFWIKVEDIDIVPPNENFFAARGYTAPASAFSEMVGDIILTQESPGRLYNVRWNPSMNAFQAQEIASIGSAQFEHVTFSTAGLNALPPPPQTVSFTYKANDTQADSNVATVAITVAEMNQAPSITSAPLTHAYAERAYDTQVVATDPNAGDTIAFSLSTSPAGMTIGAASGLIGWTPSTADIGTHTVSVKVTDQKGAFATQTFVVEVFDGPPLRLVPNVLRLTAANAVASIEGAGLSVGSVFSDYSESVTEGLVISQSPSGGSYAGEGTPINVVVSLGRHPTTVPSMVGLSEDAAATALANATLQMGSVTHETSATVPAGLVASQSVAAGASVPRGTAVDLVISLGKPILLPNLTGGTQAAALATIQAAGLSVGSVTQASSFTVASGYVISQSPAGGTGVSPGTAVDLVVSTGPPMTSVPNVVGQTQTDATAAIVSAQLTVGSTTPAASTTVPAGEVISQSPAAGSTAPQGSAVNLVVSTGNTVNLTNLAGLSRSQAEAAIVAAGLTVGGVTETQSTTVPRGFVIEQNPLPGTNVEVGGAVALLVSSGPALLAPSFAGLSQSEAEAAIVAAGLSVGTVSQVQSNVVAAGHVIEQSPPASAVVLEGSTVNLVVSLGPAFGSDLSRPVVHIALSSATAPVGGSITITMTTSDPEGVVSGTLQVNGEIIALVDGSATYTSNVAGVFTAEAFAYDLSGNQGYATAAFRFQEPGDTSNPTVTIASPTAGQEITMPVEIRGSVGDETQVVAYTIEASPAGKNQYFEVGGGTAPVTDGVIGTFDPTVLVNGLYDLRVSVEDASGNITSSVVTVQVDGQAKVGNFTIGFDDLVVPVSGIPITITRTYDSRNKSKSDFGVGWTLSVKDMEVQESGTLGAQWQQSKSGLWFPKYTLSPSKPKRVSVRFPNGRLDTFDMVVTPSTQSIMPIEFATVSFRPSSPRTFSRLDALYTNQVVTDPPSVGALTLRTLDMNVYDPTRYKLTDSDGTVYVLNQTSGLESITDTNGNTITFGPNGIIHSAGASVTYTRDSQGRITEVTNPEGGKIGYTYDAYGDLLAVTDQDGNTTRFRYNTTHGLLDIIDPLGRGVARNEYDDAGRLIAMIDAAGKRTEFTHSLNTRQEVVKNRLGEVTVHEYDTRGNVVATTDHLGNRSTFAYDSRDNLLTQTDPLGHTTTHTYDARNNRTSSTNALGQITASTYNALGQVLTTTDPAGRITTNTYDARGNQTNVTDPAGRATRMTYDTQGNVVSTTDPLGRTTYVQYDRYGNPVSSTDAAGNIVRMGYDASGNLTSLTPPGRPAHGFAYTAAGLTTEYRPPILPSLPEVRTLYSYDAAGRLTEVRRPDGIDLGQSYDSAGRLTEQTFDASYPQSGARVVSFSYDDEGQLLTATAADGGVLTNAYELGRLTQTAWNGTVSGSVTRSYDDAGRVDTQQVNGGNPVTYTYDDANRLTAVGAMTLTRSAADGRLTGTMLGVVSDAFGYTAAGDYQGYNAAIGGTTAYDVQYVRDGLGRIEEKIETIDGATDAYHYTYDASGRLTDVSKNGTPTSHYEYDANGNRLSGFNDISGNQVATYDDQDRLLSTQTSTGVTSYSYTANGELSSKTDSTGTTTYAYDVLGNLLRVDLPDGRVIEYVVDGQNRRVGKKISPAPGQPPELVQGWLYDGQVRIVAELDGSGAVVSRFVYAESENSPEYMIRGGVTYRIVKDHLGSPRLLVETTSGAVVQRMDFDEFGNVLTDTTPAFQSFGFAGGLHDRDTGLVRFGVRDYSADIGRWLSKDPIRFEGGDTNLYGYVLDDPINFNDPEGESTLSKVMAGLSLLSVLVSIHATVNWLSQAIQGQFSAKKIAVDVGWGVVFFGMARFGGNTALNKQAVQALKQALAKVGIPFSRTIRREFHDFITGQGIVGYQNLVRAAEEFIAYRFGK